MIHSAGVTNGWVDSPQASLVTQSLAPLLSSNILIRIQDRFRIIATGTEFMKWGNLGAQPSGAFHLLWPKFSYFFYFAVFDEFVVGNFALGRCVIST